MHSGMLRCDSQQCDLKIAFILCCNVIGGIYACATGRSKCVLTHVPSHKQSLRRKTESEVQSDDTFAATAPRITCRELRDNLCTLLDV